MLGGDRLKTAGAVAVFLALRELLDTIETAGVANWRNNELWPVVRTVAAKIQALLSR